MHATVHVDLPAFTISEHLILDGSYLRLERPSVVYVIAGSARIRAEGESVDVAAGQTLAGSALCLSGTARVLSCTSDSFASFGEADRVVVSAGPSNHYRWGEGCHGWRLVETPALAVREERMPAGASEVPHVHRRATQFFYTLSGRPVMAYEKFQTPVDQGTGVLVPPGVTHQLTCPGPADARFLVLSAPATADDRVDVPQLRPEQ